MNYLVGALKISMKYAIAIAFLSLALAALVSGRSVQDKYVLRRTYSQIYGFNRNLKISRKLEKLAQEHRCIRRHRDHRSTDKEALSVYNNLRSIIACKGGCEEEFTNWSRQSPARIWYLFRQKTGHYSAIMKSNRVGCSAAKDRDEWCVFCYLASAGARSNLLILEELVIPSEDVEADVEDIMPTMEPGDAVAIIPMESGEARAMILMESMEAEASITVEPEEVDTIIPFLPEE